MGRLHREDLGPLFQPDAFAKALPTQHQQGIQALVIAYLKEHGGIDAPTVQKLGRERHADRYGRLASQGAGRIYSQSSELLHHGMMEHYSSTPRANQ